MKPCQFCAREHDTSLRMTGDVILCPCGASLRVQHVDGGGCLLIALTAPENSLRLLRGKPRARKAWYAKGLNDDNPA